MKAADFQSSYGLEHHGIQNVGNVYWNLRTTLLYEHVIRRSEGAVVHLGPIAVRTGIHTGRAAKDKYVVREQSTEGDFWWQVGNRPLDPPAFDRLYLRVLAYLQGHDLYVQDCYAGADPEYRIRLRVVNETAWHNLFARVMFIRAPVEALQSFVPEMTVIQVPTFNADPDTDGTARETFVVLNLARRIILIGGTAYAGEIKKAVFSVLNYVLPKRGVLSMHSAANVGKNNDVAVFFGLSGTGKTTLSADPLRRLIGDDEHGWSNRGIFNFEGGCYAKAIHLSPSDEPQIYEATRRFGTILENVAYDTWSRRLDLDDASLTENTRAAYPITHIPSALSEGIAGHPKNIVMLTCDAFGIMPPLARLTPEQAMYHFIAGYTAKVGGTESGTGAEPTATFSACFGQPFMTLHPYEYAKLLAKRIAEYDVNCWLVNTGWSGGPFGVGSRISIEHTRALVRAALSGTLQSSSMRVEPVFGLSVPVSCEGVPPRVLDVRQTWSDGATYDASAARLAERFRQNFAQYDGVVPVELRKAGPGAH